MEWWSDPSGELRAILPVGHPNRVKTGLRRRDSSVQMSEEYASA